jgi:hypothetical protein
MKPHIFDALKRFEERLQGVLPGASFRLTDPSDGNDLGLEVILPRAPITREERLKIAEIAADIEEEFEVYIGTVAKPQA